MDPSSYLPSVLPTFLNTNRVVIKRALLKMIGAQFHIHDSVTGAEVALAIQKGFKLKEDIRISVGGVETIGIFARQSIDFSAAYDVVDLTQTPNVRIGVLKRQGLKSTFVRDEWLVFDAWEREIGILTEDSPWLGLIRRMLTNLIPQNYDLLMGSVKAVDLKQNFNPFSYHLNVDFLVPPETIDRRIGLAAGILIAAIEGRQR